MAMIKSKGDIGHLCLVPLLIVITSDVSLFTCIHAVGSVYSNLIRLIYPLGSISLRTLANMNALSRESKAFSASNNVAAANTSGDTCCED